MIKIGTDPPEFEPLCTGPLTNQKESLPQQLSHNASLFSHPQTLHADTLDNGIGVNYVSVIGILQVKHLNKC